MRGRKGEASEGMGKGKSLGGDFVKRRATLLFLNCELLSANIWSDWRLVGGRL